MNRSKFCILQNIYIVIILNWNDNINIIKILSYKISFYTSQNKVVTTNNILSGLYWYLTSQSFLTKWSNT